MSTTADVLVIGAGPAGSAAAAACGAAGLATVVVDEAPGRAWPNTYGAWVDDVADAELAGAMRRTWSRVRIEHVCTDLVQRTYGLVDNERWRTLLRDRALRAGVRFVPGRATAAEHHPDGARVTVDGETWSARVVVDASGAGGGLLRRGGEPTLFQVAWGETIEADLGADMRWMEFGDEGSFLYAMPLGDGRVFVEETALVTTGVSYEVLQQRLRLRLELLGVRAGPPSSVERVRIPMDLPIPPVQRVVAFGASAGMVHPATGYLLPRVIAQAPTLAAALATHLDLGPAEAARAAWHALWPTRRLRQRELHRWGSEVVSRLGPAELRTFFASFFALPPETVRGWLADTLPPSRLAAAMTAVFGRLPFHLKWRVATGSRAVLASLAPRLLEVP